MVRARRAALDAALAAAGLRPAPGAPTQLLQYYPPFAPAWQRLCEVAVEVEGEGSGGGAAPATAVAE